jgi:hypothetical protein
MISLKVSKKELEWIYASINWYISERRHMSRKDRTEFDLLIERVYNYLKMKGKRIVVLGFII